MRILVAASITLAGLLTLSVAAAQQPAPADDPRFTGISTVLDAKDLSAARRRFEPGARSAWHSHDNGQLLFVEKGRGRTQKRGMAMRELGPGDSDYTGPNVIHWHGAVPGRSSSRSTSASAAKRNGWRRRRTTSTRGRYGSS